jgi:hypothetical protein
MIYDVIRKSDGMAMTRYCSSQVVEQINENAYPVSEFDHVERLEDAVIADTRKFGGRRRLTKTEFRDSFSTQEKVGIEFASVDSPQAPEAERLIAAQIRVFLDDVASTTPDLDGTSISLDDPRTVAGVVGLESLGLLAPGRAQEILNG